MQDLITAYADGELQGADRQATEKHLSECALCAGVLANVTAMKSAMKADALKFNAPGALLKRIDSLIEKTIEPATKAANQRPTARTKWVPVALAAGALGALIAAYFLFWPSARQQLEANAVADHQRAVQTNHLVEITTSDPKTLSTWFSTRINFSPMIPPHLPAGTTLVGGRVDKINNQPVAAIVFRTGSNTADVFQSPSHNGASPASSDTINGANVTAWNSGGISFAVVSDTGAEANPDITALFTAQGCGPQ